MLLGGDQQAQPSLSTVGMQSLLLEIEGPSQMRAVGGAFDSDTAVGMMSIAHSRRRCASVLAIVIRQQEVRPMNAVSTVGAPLQSTIARLS